MKNATIKINDSYLKIIKDILRKHVLGCEVRAFGSRLTEQAKSYSDLDLAVIGDGKIERSKMINLKEAFEESIIPFRVDVIDWCRASKSFKRVVEKNYLVIQLR